MVTSNDSSRKKRSFSDGEEVKNPPTSAGDVRHRFNPWVRKIPRSRKWQPAPAFLFGKFNGQKSLVGYHSWGCKELDTTVQLSKHIHTHGLNR